MPPPVSYFHKEFSLWTFRKDQQHVAIQMHYGAQMKSMSTISWIRPVYSYCEPEALNLLLLEELAVCDI
jgi:hypothetical protein